MEDKNTNPMADQPGDMPQFDPSEFAADTAVPAETSMDPIFGSAPSGEELPDADAIISEILAEEDASAEAPVFGEPDPDAPAEEYQGGVYPPDEPDYDTGMPDPEAYNPPVWADADETPADDDSAFTPAAEAPPVVTVMDENGEFVEMTEDAEDSASAEPAPAPQPVRKGRPKRKKGEGLLGIPHLLASLIWLAIVVSIGVSLGRMLWVCAADVLAFGREEKEVVVTIGADATIEDIAEILHNKGLIRYPGVFKLYASIAVDEGEIAPGTYTLNTILDYHALVGQMSSTSSSRAVVEDVLIPEGYNCRQIFELLEQNGICTVAELEEYAANGEFQDFWFLEGVERGDKYCLEGFLFPDTYDFYAGSTPREALGKMLLGFNARFTEEMYNQLPALNERISGMMRKNGCSEEFIAANQLDLYDLLTVASLIEEETSGASESPTIASVIFNRLTQDQVYERYLGIDAAIIYATGDSENIDTTMDSPYNTYKNAGLTPTPISNPGLSSIKAALNFEDTAYYYYVLNPATGTHQFSKTYEEHQKWVEEFRNAS